MGGENTYQIQQPTPPTPQSQSDTLSDYVANYPKLVELQKTYEPQLAALQKGINEQLYPNVSSLSESLAKTASEGMNNVPSWMTQAEDDRLRSVLGRNLVYNNKAQQDYSVGLNQANESWKQYYQNLGLSISNKQPLAQGNSNITSSYTPTTALNYAASTYSPYASAYSSMYGTNANYNYNMNKLYNSPMQYGWNAQQGLNFSGGI